MNNDIISKIKDRLDILEVVSKDVILKKSGNNYWGLCPFHKEKTPSFSVNPTKGIYKCFGCGEGGDALSYLLKTKGVSFWELIEELAEEFKIELPKSTHKKNYKEEKDKMIKACTAAADFFQENLYSDNSKKVLEYLSNRGIGDDIIANYGLGFAPKEPAKLYNYLKDKFSNDILEKAGLTLKSPKYEYYDRFRNRITIPIHDEDGDIVAFGARAIEEGQNPKYLNSPDTLIYNKSKLLYGLYFAKEEVKKQDSIIIMEGYFDVISAQAHGVKNCVASCGTSLTQDHIKLISRYTKSRKIYLSFDTDNAGLKATTRGAGVIKEAFTGLGEIKQFDENFSEVSNDKYISEIRVISPPQGKDPDEFIRTVGKDEYMKYLEHAPLLIDFQINGVLKNCKNNSTPIEKSNAVKELIPILLEVKNKIIRSEYIKTIASSLAIDEKSLYAEVENSDKAFDNGISVKNPIVTKSSNLLEKTQKNLLSLYLVNVNPLGLQELSEQISKVEFQNSLKIVKDTIDKLICTINNGKVLAERLYVEFAEQEELKEIVTDLICISEAFDKLAPKDFQSAITESLSKIERLRREEERKQMKQIYESVNDNETESFKVQVQLRDKQNSWRK